MNQKDELCNCGHAAEYHSGGYGDCMTASGCDCRGFDDTPVVAKMSEPPNETVTKCNQLNSVATPAESAAKEETTNTWVPVYVERAICDLIPDTGYAREIARSAWAWDDEHPGYENTLYRWQNEAIRQRRDLIALQELIEHERNPYQDRCGLVYAKIGENLGVVCVRPKGHDSYHATTAEDVITAQGGFFWHDN